MNESNRIQRAALFGLSALAILGAGGFACKSDAPQRAEVVDPGSPQFYQTEVRPILQSNCYRCHSGFNHRGGLQLDTKEHLLHGGKDGAVIVPGQPEHSMLLRLVRHEGPAKHPMPMPPKDRLSDADIAKITQWIQAGAKMPDGTGY